MQHIELNLHVKLNYGDFPYSKSNFSFQMTTNHRKCRLAERRHQLNVSVVWDLNTICLPLSCWLLQCVQILNITY